MLLVALSDYCVFITMSMSTLRRRAAKQLSWRATVTTALVSQQPELETGARDGTTSLYPYICMYT